MKDNGGGKRRALAEGVSIFRQWYYKTAETVMQLASATNILSKLLVSDSKKGEIGIEKPHDWVNNPWTDRGAHLSFGRTRRLLWEVEHVKNCNIVICGNQDHNSRSG